MTEKPWRTPKRKKLEKDVEGPCKAWARERGWYVRKFKAPGNRSVPDDIFIKNGRHVFVEFKRPRKTSTEQQQAEQKAIRLAGGEVYADVDSKEKFRAIFERIERELAGQGHWLL